MEGNNILLTLKGVRCALIELIKSPVVFTDCRFSNFVQRIPTRRGMSAKSTTNSADAGKKEEMYWDPHPKSQWGPEIDAILYPQEEEEPEDDREEIWRDEEDEDEEFWDTEPMPWVSKNRR